MCIKKNISNFLNEGTLKINKSTFKSKYQWKYVFVNNN